MKQKRLTDFSVMRVAPKLGTEPCVQKFEKKKKKTRMHSYVQCQPDHYKNVIGGSQEIVHSKKFVTEAKLVHSDLWSWGTGNGILKISLDKICLFVLMNQIKAA